mmetsp:Transcript_103205/g.301011  ORF Transcript_103205/g.301011 Transcript_103205/m.301011 type:complete len:206 (+) Transcript_103205:165-782(+)
MREDQHTCTTRGQHPPLSQQFGRTLATAGPLHLGMLQRLVRCQSWRGPSANCGPKLLRIRRGVLLSEPACDALPLLGSEVAVEEAWPPDLRPTRCRGMLAAAGDGCWPRGVDAEGAGSWVVASGCCSAGGGNRWPVATCSCSLCALRSVAAVGCLAAAASDGGGLSTRGRSAADGGEGGVRSPHGMGRLAAVCFWVAAVSGDGGH